MAFMIWGVSAVITVSPGIMAEFLTYPAATLRLHRFRPSFVQAAGLAALQAEPSQTLDLACEDPKH
jgi:hypothetical protein